MKVAMLELSTAHVSEDTAKKLSDVLEQFMGTAPFVSYLKGDYGWFVPTLDKMDPRCPSDLMVVIGYARTIGCSWIMFDRDADTIDDLPTFDW